MSCPEDRSRLSAWVDGELGPTEASELERHVSSCVSCADLVQSIRGLRGALAVDIEPDPGFVVRFRERRDELSIAPWWTWRQLALRLVPAALGALLLAWLVVASKTPGPEPDLQAFEAEAIGSGTTFDPGAGLSEEPVLSIALGPFPEEVP